MAICFNITASLKMTILNLNTDTTVENWVEKGVLDNLQMGEYVISLNRNLIFDINDLETPLYKFEVESDDNDEYLFEEEW